MSDYAKSKQSRETILNAAIKEFAEKGYKGASTNAICKRAGVSKGLVFHYYKDKSTLFYYCVKKGIEEYERMIQLDLILAERDIFERVKLINSEQGRFLRTYQDFCAIFNALFLLPDDKEYEAVKKLSLEYNAFMSEKYVENLDFSTIKAVIDQKLIVEYIMKSFDLMNNILEKKYGCAVYNYGEYEVMMDRFINMLKYGMCK